MLISIIFMYTIQHNNVLLILATLRVSALFMGHHQAYNYITKTYVNEGEFCDQRLYTYIHSFVALHYFIIGKFVNYLWRIFKVPCSTTVIQKPL